MEDFNQINNPNEVKLKRIIGLTALSIVVICLAVGTIINCIKLKNSDLTVIGSGHVDNWVQTGEFIAKFSADNPDVKLERVSYSAYRFVAGKNAGEAVLHFEDNEDSDSVINNRCIIVNYEYIKSEIEIGDETMIGDYIDSKQSEIIDIKASEIVQSMEHIVKTLGQPDFSDYTRQQLCSLIKKANNKGGCYVYYLGELSLHISDNEENETIDVRINEVTKDGGY